MLRQFNWGYILLGCIGLFLVYIFQNYLDFYGLFTRGEFGQPLNYTASFQDVSLLEFSVNKAFRYILNDLFAICLIYGLFTEVKYVRFAMYVLLTGLLLLVPLYIYLYYVQPEGFSSMLSHLHRLVMNPVLMMLLIPPFFYQKYFRNTERE